MVSKGNSVAAKKNQGTRPPTNARIIQKHGMSKSNNWEGGRGFILKSTYLVQSKTANGKNREERRAETHKQKSEFAGSRKWNESGRIVATGDQQTIANTISASSAKGV